MIKERTDVTESFEEIIIIDNPLNKNNLRGKKLKDLISEMLEVNSRESYYQSERDIANNRQYTVDVDAASRTVEKSEANHLKLIDIPQIIEKLTKSKRLQNVNPKRKERIPNKGKTVLPKGERRNIKLSDIPTLLENIFYQKYQRKKDTIKNSSNTGNIPVYITLNKKLQSLIENEKDYVASPVFVEEDDTFKLIDILDMLKSINQHKNDGLAKKRSNSQKDNKTKDKIPTFINIISKKSIPAEKNVSKETGLAPKATESNGETLGNTLR